jgi:hypothetical protein
MKMSIECAYKLSQPKINLYISIRILLAGHSRIDYLIVIATICVLTANTLEDSCKRFIFLVSIRKNCNFT